MYVTKEVLNLSFGYILENGNFEEDYKTDHRNIILWNSVQRFEMNGVFYKTIFPFAQYLQPNVSNDKNLAVNRK